MRLFVGIPVNPAAAPDLRRLQNQLMSGVPPKQADELRWSSPEDWHITLQFLGHVNGEQYHCVAAALQTLSFPGFSVHLDRMWVFDRAGVLYAEVQPTPELLALEQAVLALTRPCGFVPEDRPYHPHVTLARRRGRHSDLLRTLAQQPFAGLTFAAEQVVLYESQSSVSGSRYVPREMVPLTSSLT